MRASKGAQFEREICRMLSLWWTKGQRDDVFWRTSQSGGRATFRMQKGLRTFGSYGDIAAIDPIGLPLLQEWTIELKRGNSYGSPFEIIDAPDRSAQKPWEKIILQAYHQHRAAGSRGWMLVHRRDRREAMAYLDWPSIRRWGLEQAVPFVGLRCEVEEDGKRFLVMYGGLKFCDLLQIIEPREVYEAHCASGQDAVQVRPD